MTREEHLLSMIAEECAEIAQRASKALRFGLEESEPGQDKNNALRIVLEYIDLQTVIEMLHSCSPVFRMSNIDTAKQLESLMQAKREKVEKYLGYSRFRGRLEGA